MKWITQNMGLIGRQYVGVPAKWITYLYQNYGIYTMLNHSLDDMVLPSITAGL
jgi:hypothetical protein